LTCNATHDVAYVREVIVNHGECGVAMSAWVGGWCENGDDRPHTLKLDGSLKITLPHTASGHDQIPQHWGKCLAHARSFDTNQHPISDTIKPCIFFC
ncbi:MAG: hypothetical protein VW518_02145, partial [Burkholderiaceae bacterium]